MKQKVAIIFTGGTISMRIDQNINAAVPSLDGEEILAFLKDNATLTDIITDNFASLPSPYITPSKMLELSKHVQKYIARDDICGVVITHGTDTLEETAYFLDLNIRTPKPIVLVGSMRNVSELGYDGPANLLAAIRVASAKEARNKGVMVVMNGDINASNEVMKTHTMALDTFKSLEFGPLGIVDDDKVLFYRNSTHISAYIPSEKVEEKVYLIKVVAGMDGELIEYLISNQAKGIIIEAFGRGNVPPAMVPSIKKALDNKIIVVLVSRCPKGRVAESYGYPGGSKKLCELGVIFGSNLSGQKARIKLMLALGYNDDYNYIKKVFKD